MARYVTITEATPAAPWISARRSGNRGVGRGETKTMAAKPSIEATTKATDDKEIRVSTTTEHP
jgi:hypothetical protein